MHWTEAVLGAVGGQGDVEVRESEAFQHLGGWAQEGDGSVAAPLFRRFASFGDRNDDGLFPDVGDLCVGYGEVENLG